MWHRMYHFFLVSCVLIFAAIDSWTSFSIGFCLKFSGYLTFVPNDVLNLWNSIMPVGILVRKSQLHKVIIITNSYFFRIFEYSLLFIIFSINSKLNAPHSIVLSMLCLTISRKSLGLRPLFFLTSLHSDHTFWLSYANLRFADQTGTIGESSVYR